jgi:PPOX class probable F420-dependent enzyme
VTILPDTHLDVAHSSPVAVLSTFGPDGFPQSTAVGFLLDGDVFRISVGTDKQKFKNLQRRPECSLFIFDPANQHRTLEVRGRAELIPDDDYTWAAQIAGRHGGSADDVRRVAVPGSRRFCIAVHPVKATTFG